MYISRNRRNRKSGYMKPSAADQILQLVIGYCNQHLDNEYTEVCSRVFNNLLKENSTIFDRGKSEIWSAAIVWAVGSNNFLGDKSFEPYASLDDVCKYFNANTSSVGQKASKIRKMLNIDMFNADYQTTTEASDFLNSLVMTPEGFIVPADMFEDHSQEIEPEVLIRDEPMEYLLVLNSLRKIDNATLYQLEHFVKTSISRESKLIRIEKQSIYTVLVTFFGTRRDIELLDSKLKITAFEIVNIYFEDPEGEDN